MKFEEIEQIIKNRNTYDDWTLHSRAGDYSSVDYCLCETPVHCVIYPETEQFQFVYVTQGFFKLDSGIMGSFLNEKHFSSRFNAFMKIVIKLED